MRTLALSVAVVVVLGLVTLLWQVSRDPEPLAPPPREAAVHRAPDAPVVVVRHPQAVPPTALAFKPEPAPPARPDASPEAEVAVERDRLQARFAGELADPAWASVARQELATDFGRLGGDDVRIDNIECRSSMCRAELALAGAAAGRAFLQTWIHQRTWTGPAFATADKARPDGAQRLIVFLGKPGVDLAPVD